MATAIDDVGPWVLWEGQVRWTQSHLDEATKQYKSWPHIALCKIVIDQYGQLTFLQGWESELPRHMNWMLAADMGDAPIQHIADQALRELFRKSREQTAAINADERVEGLEMEIAEWRADFAEVSEKSTQLELRSKELLRDAESLRAQLKAKTEEAASWQRRFEETQREPAAEGNLAVPLPKQGDFDPAREIESGSVVGAVLEYLHDHGPTSQSELPALIKRSGGAVSTAKQRLVFLGWVKDDNYKLSLAREIPNIGPPAFQSFEAASVILATGENGNGDSD